MKYHESKIIEEVKNADIYEIAYFKGGAESAFRLAIYNLIKSSFLILAAHTYLIDEDKLPLVNKLHILEREIYLYLKKYPGQPQFLIDFYKTSDTYGSEEITKLFASYEEKFKILKTENVIGKYLTLFEKYNFIFPDVKKLYIDLIRSEFPNPSCYGF